MARFLIWTILGVAAAQPVYAEDIRVLLRKGALVGIRQNQAYELYIENYEAVANPKKESNKIRKMKGTGFEAKAWANREPVYVRAPAIEGNPVKLQLPKGLEVKLTHSTVRCLMGSWRRPELFCPEGAEAFGDRWRFEAKSLRANADTEDLVFGGGVLGTWIRF